MGVIGCDEAKEFMLSDVAESEEVVSMGEDEDEDDSSSEDTIEAAFLLERAKAIYSASESEPIEEMYEGLSTYVQELQEVNVTKVSWSDVKDVVLDNGKSKENGAGLFFFKKLKSFGSENADAMIKNQSPLALIFAVQLTMDGMEYEVNFDKSIKNT